MQAPTEERPLGVRVAGYGPDSDLPPPAQRQAGRGAWTYFWTWLVTPHLEFGAIYIGMIVVLLLDVSLLQALIGVFLGTAFGAFTHGILTANGVRLRVPQIVLGKLAFGARGNALVTTVMAIVSSLGWFIVNSVVAALAINALFDVPTVGALVIVVAVQLILAEVSTRFPKIRLMRIQQSLLPISTTLLVIAGLTIFTKVDPSAGPSIAWNMNGLIAMIVVACLAWAYTIGWAPYTTDQSRFVPASVSPRAAGVGAAIGLFSATAFLMGVGASAAIILEGNVGRSTNPADQFASTLPGWLGVLVLLTLILGSWANNSITIKSARHVFNVEKLRLHPGLSRLIAPLAMSLAAFFLGWAALGNLPANYEGFVMVIGIWIGPWFNVILIDQYIRRKSDVTSLLYDETTSFKWGLFSVGFGVMASVCIWALQVFDDGAMPHGGHAYAAFGMLGGFYLCAILYGLGVKRVIKQHDTGNKTEAPTGPSDGGV